MNDADQTKEQLLNELARLRQRVTELEAEHIQVTKALQTSEEELAAIYYNAPLIMLFVDGEHRVLKINRAASDFADRAAADMIGLRSGEALRCLHSLDDPKGCGFGPHCQSCVVRRVALDTLTTGRSHSQVEGSLPFLIEGEEKELTFLISTTRLSIGEQPAALVSILDITERKQIEEKLRESETRYRQLFEMESDARFLIDNDTGHILEANPAAASLYGYSREELLELRNVDLSAEPDESHRTIQARITHTPVRLHRKKDGTVFPVEITRGFFIWHGHQVHVAATRDITERLQAEAALQEKTAELDQFFSNALDLLCIADTDGYFRRLNAEWETTLGYTLAELEGRRFLDFVHPDDLQATLEAIADLEAQREVLNFTNRYRCKDGSYRWIEWRSFPAGKAIHAAARDITERKQVEKALRHRSQQLAVLNEITRIGTATLDQAELLQTLADTAAGIIKADGCYITLWDEATQQTIPAAAYSPERDTYSSEASFLRRANTDRVPAPGRAPAGRRGRV